INDEGTDSDILISIPASSEGDPPSTTRDVTELAKEYLAEERRRIRLYDLVATAVRRSIAATAESNFPVQGVQFSNDEFFARLRRYEQVTATLREVVAAIAYWGAENHTSALILPFTRF